MKIKSSFIMLLIAVCCLLFVTACTNDTPLEYGNLTLSFTDAEAVQRGLSINDTVTEIDTIMIHGTHADGPTFDRTLDFSVTTTINTLLSGAWDFTITAYNESEELIGRGTGSTTIIANDRASLSVTIYLLEGEGTVTFSSSWPAELIAEPQIVATLTKVGDDEDPIALQCSINNGVATANTQIDAGTYTVAYALYEGAGRDAADRVFGDASSLFLAAGQTVTIACPLVQQEMRLSGSLDVTVDIDMRPEYAVSVNPKTQTVFYSKPVNLSVTATPPSATASYTYQWYLDGDVLTGETSSSITLTDLTIGMHNVAAFVHSGTTAISDNATIEVILPEIHNVTYNGNGNTTGTVPVDTYDYIEGEDIVVPSSGNLTKEGYYFYSWNTKADGSGSHYRSGDTLPMGATDLTLYAYWKAVGVPQISAKYAHVLMIKRDRTLWATGTNTAGELLDGFSDVVNTSPKKVMSLYDEVVKVSTGSSYSMVIKADGTLWAAGTNTCGKLGDGTTTTRQNRVYIMDDVADVATGECHTLALKEDGKVYGWGFNGGRLGLPLIVQTPDPLLIAEDVRAIFAGKYNSFLIKNDATLWASGLNGGILGTGDTGDKEIFTKVMDDVKLISSGSSGLSGHTLIVTTNGDLYATGYNEYGQLGDGTKTDKSTPTFIMGDVATVSAGDLHSMIVKTDGTLWATGYNNDYALGDGSNPSVNRTEFYQIDSDVQFVESGNGRSIYMKKDGSVWVTGTNGYEHFGFGDLLNKRSPIKVFEMW